MSDDDDPRRRAARLLAASRHAMPADQARDNIRRRRTRLLDPADNPVAEPDVAAREPMPLLDDPDGFAERFWNRKKKTLPTPSPAKGPRLVVDNPAPLPPAPATGPLAEAERVLANGEYRAAIAAAAVVLESAIRTLVNGSAARADTPLTLAQLVAEARRRKKIDAAMATRLQEAVRIRNRAVHETAQPTQVEAERVLATISELLASLSPRKQP